MIIYKLNIKGDIMLSADRLIDYIHAKQREIKILAGKRLVNIEKSRVNFDEIKKYIDEFCESETEYYPRFLMMPGLRGVGKTTILYQLYQYLINTKKIDEKNILYLDISDLKSAYDVGIKEVFDVYMENVHQCIPAGLDEKVFLFVDEAQLDENWVKYGKLIFDKTFNVFMIFTGSSALNFELNTDASRRVIRKQIFPCSFREYLILNNNLELKENNFKDLIFRGDAESIDKAIQDEIFLKKELIKLNNEPEIELKKFLHSQSFPYALKLSEPEIHQLTNDMIKKIVNDDLNQFKSFNNMTNDNIMRMLTYLATKKPGTTSNTSIAQSLNISVKTVSKVLQALEKTQLIFSINAYGAGGRMLKKPAQHFFQSPSIKAALNYRVGRYDLNHEKCFATLFENLVASSLYRLSYESMSSLGIFYDSNKKGVDFIVKHLDRIIPVEVGIGKKTKSQLTIAKNSYGADYGILISNRTSNIKFENNILYIPLLTFALMS